jgi:hypothetical protein
VTVVKATSRWGAARRLAVAAGAVAVVALATGCVTDLTEQLGGPGFTVRAINNSGAVLVNDRNGYLRVDPDGTRTPMARPGIAGSPSMMNNEGIVAGTTQIGQVTSRLSTYPTVWNLRGEATVLREGLEGSTVAGFWASPIDLNNRGQVFAFLRYQPGGADSVPVHRNFVWNVPTGTTAFLPDVASGGSFGAINDHGVIIGHNRAGTSFRLTPEADGSYTEAGYEELPLNGVTLNNAGDVVGVVDNAHFAVLKAGTATPIDLAPHGLPTDPMIAGSEPMPLISDNGTVFAAPGNGPGSAGHPVRYVNAVENPATAPEVFPGLEGSTQETIASVSDSGVAAGNARGADGVSRPFKWS